MRRPVRDGETVPPQCPECEARAGGTARTPAATAQQAPSALALRSRAEDAAIQWFDAAVEGAFGLTPAERLALQARVAPQGCRFYGRPGREQSRTLVPGCGVVRLSFIFERLRTGISPATLEATGLSKSNAS
jgi:hypothetical protein